jgi:hypothetical protein
LQITDDRKRRVIDLYFNQHKSYAEIAQIERISPRDIHAIIKEEESIQQKYKDQQRQEEVSSRAYTLFSEGKRAVEVAITMNLGQPEVSKLYREYWKLKGLHKLYCAYTELGDEGIAAFLKLYRLMKKKGMSIEQVIDAVYAAIHKLPYIENLYEQVKEQVEKMQHTGQGLANDIEERKNKISLLDNIIFSSEQDCKRKEQRVQELNDKKYRLERLIVNIINGEDYSKAKQIIKENIKAIISDNKKLIIISFVALIQTIKADPQMVKIIHNMPSANDGEQYKDNHINITQYFESNKDRILNLGEKNYENLVEALTNNAISSAASSFSNPT